MYWIVPEPQLPMKHIFWDTFSEDVDEYWSDAIPEIESIDTIFQELQTIFSAPKKKKKSNENNLTYKHHQCNKYNERAI